MVKTEAIVIRKNRRPAIVNLKPNQTMFKLDKKEYHVDPDATVFGKYWPWYKFKLGYNECNRYYYPEDSVKPVKFHELSKKARNGDSMLISPGELHQIFNPRFYEIIAKAGKNPKQDILIIMVAGTLFAALYTAWQVMRIVSTLGI